MKTSTHMQIKTSWLCKLNLLLLCSI